MKNFISILLILVTLTNAACGPGLAKFPAGSPRDLFLNHRAIFFKVTNRAGNGGGSGFAVTTPDGHKVILTNRHVCKHSMFDGDKIGLFRDDGVEAVGTVLGISEKADLCAISGPITEALDLAQHRPLTMALLFEIGHPFLLPLTLSIGVVQEMDKLAFVNDRDGVDILLLDQTTVPTFPGNSGSPIIDEDSHVVGVMTASGPPLYLGLATGLDAIREFLAAY